MARHLVWLFVIALSRSNLANGQINHIEVKTSGRDCPVGHTTFGAVGEYECLQGIAKGELDPSDPHNAIIQDLTLAPHNRSGRVAYSSTFTLILPRDRSKWSGVLLYEVVNRGASILPNRYETGDAFLVSGWQGDIPFGGKSIYGTPGETISVPVATNPDGSFVTGPVLARFVNIAPGLQTLPLRSAIGYATSGPAPLPVTLDTHQSKLITKRFEAVDGLSSPGLPIADSDWSWGDCTHDPFPGKPDPKQICVRNGFNPSLLYQLEYSAKDPLILGIGLAAIRDIVSFFRYTEVDRDGWKNPIFRQGSHAIGRGASQAGNTLRTFLNLGFNSALNGKRVFDGLMPTIAARQNPINYRFAIPGGASGLQEIGSDGVVWWEDTPDLVRGQPTAGLLDRCRTDKVCPQIIEVLGSSEFWSLRASPDFVGTDNARDIPLPTNVRRYYIASTQHGGGKGGYQLSPPLAVTQSAPTTANPILTTPCLLPANPNSTSEITRALLDDLEQWVVAGHLPPPSAYPTLAGHLLVAPSVSAMSFPVSPVLPSPEGMPNPLLVYDLGSTFRFNDLSGVIANRPSAIVKVIAPLVPKVDADGNEVGGIHTILQQAPLGTYLGWNVTSTGFSKGQYCSLAGSYVPFSKTRSERLNLGDTRLSLEERYGTQRGYACAAKQAAEELVEHRLLLPEDATIQIKLAADSQVLPIDSVATRNDRNQADAVCKQRGKLGY